MMLNSSVRPSPLFSGLNPARAAQSNF